VILDKADILVITGIVTAPIYPVKNSITGSVIIPVKKIGRKKYGSREIIYSFTRLRYLRKVKMLLYSAG
jgi:hypothetical protein